MEYHFSHEKSSGVILFYFDLPTVYGGPGQSQFRYKRLPVLYTNQQVKYYQPGNPTAIEHYLTSLCLHVSSPNWECPIFALR
ncbi:hypothetical protein [Adhaeribacter aquaticus]|uniref:hypothetical protein n=1 Tax=Adhaeribacter aquaticus TaxID=299567 RepID=UPI00247FE8FC|nr:hypothetical protein [Adhaeribacter aquaticus]